MLFFCKTLLLSMLARKNKLVIYGLLVGFLQMLTMPYIVRKEVSYKNIWELYTWIFPIGLWMLGKIAKEGFPAWRRSIVVGITMHVAVVCCCLLHIRWFHGHVDNYLWLLGGITLASMLVGFITSQKITLVAFLTLPSFLLMHTPQALSLFFVQGQYVHALKLVSGLTLGPSLASFIAVPMVWYFVVHLMLHILKEEKK